MKIIKLGDTGDKVTEIQKLLTKHGYKTKPDGDFGVNTQAAVIAFQKKHNQVADGVVGDRTWGALYGESVTKDCDVFYRLRDKDVVNAAKKYMIPYAVLAAISEKESRGFGFTDDNKPKVLFERHWMRKNLIAAGLDVCATITQLQREDLCNSKTGGYLGGKREYQRLQTAMRINREAAMKSASYGRFQIMGFHYKTLGYKTVEEYYSDVHTSEAKHLDHFCKFVTSNTKLHKAMQDEDVETIAFLYNGPNHAKNNYVPDLVRLINKYKGV